MAPCDECDGTGDGECNECGDGRMECACDAQDFSACWACDGLGKQPFEAEEEDEE